jgi:cytochrome c oxidase subunit 5b
MFRALPRSLLTVARPTVGARALSGYVQPPLTQGAGAKDGDLPSNDDQATGREREELKALAKGFEYFNRQPVRTKPGQGTFENPVMVPSQQENRIVGMVPKGQDGPLWFEITNIGVHYVPEIDMHYKLYDPLNPFVPTEENIKQQMEAGKEEHMEEHVEAAEKA